MFKVFAVRVAFVVLALLGDASPAPFYSTAATSAEVVRVAGTPDVEGGADGEGDDV